ncbi:RidA family protein [Phytohabitans kaempferiae]|uniref:RidA family protein n=1 Tax=Phytohabitans kaempferiae TaxID=1620943 RepID=A0ABV6MGF5_9ACTN
MRGEKLPLCGGAETRHGRHAEPSTATAKAASRADSAGRPVRGPTDTATWPPSVRAAGCAALAAAGATRGDVFKLTFYVVDTSALATVGAVRDEFVERPPTSSLVQVAGLFRPDLLIEIEAVADS